MSGFATGNLSLPAVQKREREKKKKEQEEKKKEREKKKEQGKQKEQGERQASKRQTKATCRGKKVEATAARVTRSKSGSVKVLANLVSNLDMKQILKKQMAMKVRPNAQDAV